MWWSADRKKITYIEKRRSLASRPFLAGLGSGLGLGLGVGMGLRPYLDPTRKCFLARKREQPTGPIIRVARLLGELSA